MQQKEGNMLHRSGKDGICFDVGNPGAHLNFIYYRGLNFLAPFSMMDTKPRGRSHLCLPVFGKGRKDSVLFGKIPGHGDFRRVDHELLKRQWGVHCPFNIVPTKDKAYWWPLGGFVRYQSRDNELVTEVQVWRTDDEFEKNAPINIADHPYWYRWGDIEITMGDFNTVVNTHAIIPRAIKVPYSGTVDIRFTETVRVEIELKGNTLVDPQLVLWTDSSEYLCAELVMTNPDLFDTEQGASLASLKEMEPLKVIFIKRFFVES